MKVKYGKRQRRKPSFKKEVAKEPPETDGKAKFDFAYYESHKKYCLSNFSKEDIRLTLAKLQEMSNKKWSDITGPEQRTNHYNPISWGNTNEPDGFQNPALRTVEYEPYELKIAGVNNGRARIFGFPYIDTFYIVWFDYNHEVAGKSKLVLR